MRHKKMMFTSKKGVSPIIAAVLLVVITIAIGATTMAFIRGLSDQNLASAQEKSAKIKCGTDVRAEVLAIGSTYKICQNTSANYFEVTLKNVGSQDIKYFKLTILGNGTLGFTSNESSKVSNDKFLINTIKKYNFTYDGTESGTPEQYVLESVIQGEPGQDIYCADSPIKWLAADVDTCA